MGGAGTWPLLSTAQGAVSWGRAGLGPGSGTSVRLACTWSPGVVLVLAVGLCGDRRSLLPLVGRLGVSRLSIGPVRGWSGIVSAFVRGPVGGCRLRCSLAGGAGMCRCLPSVVAQLACRGLGRVGCGSGPGSSARWCEARSPSARLMLIDGRCGDVAVAAVGLSTAQGAVS